MTNKYHARRVVTEDGAFDSVREHRRWLELRILEHAGAIRNLRRQVPYELVVNGVRVARYVADFVYERDGHEVTEDVKSSATRTAVYQLKKKLMKACHAIDISEVY